MGAAEYLQELKARVQRYAEGEEAPQEGEPEKHFIVWTAVTTATRKGISVPELEAWAARQGEPTIAVCNAIDLSELVQQLKTPGGVLRFRLGM